MSVSGELIRDLIDKKPRALVEEAGSVRVAGCV
jgi:hypothetical protein